MRKRWCIILSLLLVAPLLCAGVLGFVAWFYAPSWDNVWCMAFSPDGRRLALGTMDGEVQLWDVNTHQLRWAQHTHSGYVESIAFAPNGTTLASAEDNVTLLSRATDGKVLFEVSHSIKRPVVRFSQDGKDFIVGGFSYDQTLRRWCAETGSERPFETPFRSSIKEFAPFGTQDAWVTLQGPDTIEVWRDGAIEMSLELPLAHSSGSISCIDVSDDGQHLAAGFISGRVAIYDTSTWKTVRKWTSSRGGINSVAFAKDDERLAAANAAGIVCVLDIATGSVTSLFDSPDVYVDKLALSPDGTRLAAWLHCPPLSLVGNDVRIWDLNTGLETSLYEGRHD